MTRLLIELSKHNCCGLVLEILKGCYSGNSKTLSPRLFIVINFFRKIVRVEQLVVKTTIYLGFIMYRARGGGCRGLSLG